MWFLLNHLSVKKQQLQDCMKQAKMFQYFLFVSNPTVNFFFFFFGGGGTVNFWKNKTKIYQKESTLNRARVHRSGSFHLRQLKLQSWRPKFISSGDEHYVSPRSNKIMGILCVYTYSPWILCWAHFREEETEAQRTWYLSWDHTQCESELRYSDLWCWGVSILPLKLTVIKASAILVLGGAGAKFFVLQIFRYGFVRWPLSISKPREVVPSSKHICLDLGLDRWVSA